MTPKTTVMRKVKRPEGFGRWPAYELSIDDYGIWLFSPKGTIYRGQTGSHVVELEVGQGTGDAGLPVLHLIPNARWWTAWWCSHDRPLFISVDICIPPALADGEWRYTDLELDALAYPDGRVEVHDEDEFVDACEAELISPEEATHARAALMEIERCLRDHIEPFGRVGWSKLDEAVNLGLPPIKVLADASSA